ncbi:MAG TPA: hypothetical protein ACFYD3_08795 [Candidatus Hypogeohydataceae bacterium YC41]
MNGKTETKERLRLLTVIREEALLRQRDIYPKEEKVDTWPNLVVKELICMLIFAIVLVAWAMFQNAPLEELANPGLTPKEAKAPWYFVGLQELLVYFDPWISGVVLPTVILVGLALIPYLDPDPIKGVGRYAIWNRKFAVFCFLFGFTMWFALVAVGQYFRGPYWSFYWPWESKEIAKQTEVVLTNFPLPAGIAFLAGYFILGLIVPAVAFQNFFWRLGLLRYHIAMILFMMMMLVPVKILLRQAFHIRYILKTPWFNI